MHVRISFVIDCLSHFYQGLTIVNNVLVLIIFIIMNNFYPIKKNQWAKPEIKKTARYIRLNRNFLSYYYYYYLILVSLFSHEHVVLRLIYVQNRLEKEKEREERREWEKRRKSTHIYIYIYRVEQTSLSS